MGWQTRAPTASPVLLGTRMFPTGVRLRNGTLRVFGWSRSPTYDSSDNGATWSAINGGAIPEWFPNDPATYNPTTGGTGNEVVRVRRGRSGRLYAAIIKYQTLGTWSNYPSSPGWAIKYTPWFSYSDDEAVTWSEPEAVPYNGWGAVAMDVTELPNGEIALAMNDGGTVISPPYTLDNTGEYPDSSIAIRSVGGSWSVVSPPMAAAVGDYYGGQAGSYIWGEPSIDVIHDGTTYGLAIGYLNKNTLGVGYSDKYIVRSSDGCRTWSSPVWQNSAVNRGTVLVTPDTDVVVVYFNGGAPVMRVSRDAAATFGSEITIASRSANHGVEVFPIAGPGITPNLGVTFGDGPDDAHGSGYYVPVSRGADALALTVTPNSVWSQSGTTITATRAPRNTRSIATATVVSAQGGPVQFRGTHAARFSVSLDGTTWGSTVNVSAGTTTIYLGVTPQGGDTTLTAQIGIPT